MTQRLQSFTATCPICQEQKFFTCLDDFFSARDHLTAPTCPHSACTTRERALAHILRQLFPGPALSRARIHESSPAPRGLSAWLALNCPRYLPTAYMPNHPPGAQIGPLRNENLEAQSFPDELFDLVIHLDVLEHLFHPFQALREIHRTLVPGGKCIFAVPTHTESFESCQVAFHTETGEIQTPSPPEYHADPHSPTGALVTWRYGYDLPLLISRETLFDTEVRRFQSARATATGFMTEIYILTK